MHVSSTRRLIAGASSEHVPRGLGDRPSKRGLAIGGSRPLRPTGSRHRLAWMNRDGAEAPARRRCAVAGPARRRTTRAGERAHPGAVSVPGRGLRIPPVPEKEGERDHRATVIKPNAEIGERPAKSADERGDRRRREARAAGPARAEKIGLLRGAGADAVKKPIAQPGATRLTRPLALAAAGARRSTSTATHTGIDASAEPSAPIERTSGRNAGQPDVARARPAVVPCSGDEHDAGIERSTQVSGEVPSGLKPGSQEVVASPIARATCSLIPPRPRRRD